MNDGKTFSLIGRDPTTKQLLRFEALFDEQVPNVVAGYSVWETIQRPHRRSLTNWVGSEPLKLNIGFIIDGYGGASTKIVPHSSPLRVSYHDEPVDEMCRILEVLAGGLTADGLEPPLCQLHSNGFIPHDFIHASQNRWVVTDIQWGDAIRRDDNQRYRQQGTITLMEYVQDDVVQSLSAAGKQRAAAGKPGVRRKVYVVKKGDTLRKIASKQLHNAKRWREIAKLNKIRDPKNIKVGQHLKLPR